MRKYIFTLGIILTTIIMPVYAYRSRDVTSIWTDSGHTTLAKEICPDNCAAGSCWLPGGTYYDNKGTFTETCTGGVADYTLLEYLESTGTQYINLPYTFRNTDEMGARVAMMYPGTDVSDKYFVAPSTWNNRDGNRFALGGIHIPGEGYSNKTFNFSYGDTSTSHTAFQPVTNKDTLPHLYTYKNYMFRMEDLGLSGNVSSIGFTGETTNLKLFYGYNAPTKCKIYSYYHIRGGNYLMDLVPAKRNSDGAIGMYDTVNDKFYGNSGSGSFIAGPVVSSIGGESSFDQTYARGLVDCAGCQDGYYVSSDSCVYCDPASFGSNTQTESITGGSRSRSGACTSVNTSGGTSCSCSAYNYGGWSYSCVSGAHQSGEQCVCDSGYYLSGGSCKYCDKSSFNTSESENNCSSCYTRSRSKTCTSVSVGTSSCSCSGYSYGGWNTSYGSYSHGMCILSGDGDDVGNIDFNNNNWTARFHCGGTVSGIGVCNDTAGTPGVATDANITASYGNKCWCKMTSPSVSKWVYRDYDSAGPDQCAEYCAFFCGLRVLDNRDGFRDALFSAAQ